MLGLCHRSYGLSPTLLTKNKNASEADSEGATDQCKESDDDDSNDAKRTSNVEERQRLVVLCLDVLRRAPDCLGVPIPVDVFC